MNILLVRNMYDLVVSDLPAMRDAELVVTFVTRLVATNIMQILSYTHMYTYIHKTILHVRYFLIVF